MCFMSFADLKTGEELSRDCPIIMSDSEFAKKLRPKRNNFTEEA